jgi:hypothetical protein
MPDIDISIFTYIFKMDGGSGVGMARPMHGLRAKRAFIVIFFFRFCILRLESLFLFDAGDARLQLARHPPSVARNVPPLHLSGESVFSICIVSCVVPRFSLNFLRPD